MINLVTFKVSETRHYSFVCCIILNPLLNPHTILWSGMDLGIETENADKQNIYNKNNKSKDDQCFKIGNIKCLTYNKFVIYSMTKSTIL